MQRKHLNATTTRKPTQLDVAKLAGVSQTTVSLVLNNDDTPTIPLETREKVLEAIQSLAYVPNSAARILRTNRTFTLACLIPSITNPFYPALVSGIQEEAELNGYELIIYNTRGNAQKEAKLLRSVQEGRVDGVIGVFFHTHAPDLLALFEKNIPVVRIEVRPHATGEWPLDNIYVNNEKAAFAATAYLLSKGHRQVALLTGQAGPGDARREGYRRALQESEEAAEPWEQEVALYDEKGGYQGMEALLSGTQRPTAVFAANDLLAIGAINAIQDAGLSIPDDIAVVGFDDIPTARLIKPALTTIHQGQEEMGKRAAMLLIERLGKEHPPSGRNIEMPFELLVRESA